MERTMKKILVIDAQGGGIGRQVVTELLKRNVPAEIIAVGTNTAATAAMVKAGASHAATGENPVVVCSRTADLIIGPIGIIIADSMYGEITPKMAAAVGQSSAHKILIPVTNCGNYVAGVRELSMKAYIEDAVQFAERHCAENGPKLC